MVYPALSLSILPLPNLNLFLFGILRMIVLPIPMLIPEQPLAVIHPPVAPSIRTMTILLALFVHPIEGALIAPFVHAVAMHLVIQPRTKIFVAVLSPGIEAPSRALVVLHLALVFPQEVVVVLLDLSHILCVDILVPNRVSV